MAEATDDTVPADLADDDDDPPDTMDRLLAQVAHAPAAPPPLLEGDQIGRYRLVQKLGQGGMGVVFAAHDPQLDRKVALKVLRRELAGSTMSARARDRTLREARALARLVHPNIVAVHDAGYHADELYIVMELVSGESLRDWLKARPRPPLEIARVFRQAAEGLVAAHAAGMVHRDFKPDNVLVGEDGRVRVADFGLVHIAGGSVEAGTGDASSSVELTVTGAFMGTPAYMAPEQLDGREVDARADQYAFGVSLWQAMHGALPFTHSDLAVRRQSQERGAPEPERGGGPGWLRAIVRRTMAADPAARFPDMAAVARAIDRGLARPRRIAALAVAGGVVAALGVAVALGARAAAPDRCGGGAAQLARVWNPTRAAALVGALPAGIGARAGAQLRAHLDDYARRWTLAHREACRATRIAGTQSEHALDVRMACLGRARATLDDLVARITAHEIPSDVSLAAAGTLPALDQCDEYLAVASGPDDPAARARLEALAVVVARGQADLIGVNDDASLARSAGALADARALGWTPLVVEAAVTYGNQLFERSQNPEAIAAYREGIKASLAGGTARWTALAMANLAAALAEAGKPADGLDWLELARAAATSLRVDPALRKQLAYNAWYVQRRADRLPEALAAAEAYVAAAREADGAASADHAGALQTLAVALGDLGRRTDALARTDEAIAITEGLVGPEHPALVNDLGNRASLLAELGRDAEAQAAIARAMTIIERWYGPDDRRLADQLLNAAAVHQRGGRIDASMAATERALAILARNGAGETRDYALHLANLAMARAMSGQLDEAFAGGERALAILERLTGPHSPALGNTLVLLGWVDRARGRLDASARWLERAVADGEAGLGPHHPEVANLRLELGHTEAARRRWPRAIALFETVVTGPHDGEVPPRILAEAELALAQALWDGGGDRARARALAAAARDRYRALGDDFAPAGDEAATWLVAHSR